MPYIKVMAAMVILRKLESKLMACPERAAQESGRVIPHQ